MTTDEKKTRPGRLVTWGRLAEGDASQVGSSIDWASRSGGGRRFLQDLERITLWFETLANRLIGNPHLNPLYHTDTIAFFLLVLVAASGIYLLVFYQFGYEASYESVAKMNRFPLSWLVRGVHRYSSAGLMIFTLLHAVRVLILDRFRGARRPAWVWGVVMTVALWIAGITGYLLLWDTRAQLVVESVINLLKSAPTLAAGFASAILSESGAEMSWLTMLLLLSLHIGLTALGCLFYWYHIRRLNRPKFFPARYWMIGIGLIVGILALVVPAGLLPMADFAQQPGTVALDLVYLFFVPLTLRGSWLGLLLGLAVIATLLVAMPWIIRRKEPPRIEVTPELCVGCKLCVEDCPYGALTMQPRDDGSPYKLLAEVNPERCVSCGICIGSCNTLALGLGERPARLLWQDVSGRLKLALADEIPTRAVFACERHVAHGARPFLRRSPSEPVQTVGDMQLEVVPLTCAAMVHPGLLARTLEAGAAEVQVVGCPPDDCANREGNLWLEARLARERAPKLKRTFASAPIFATWLPPDRFAEALTPRPREAAETKTPEHREEGDEEERLTWARFLLAPTGRHLVVGLALATLFLVLAVALSTFPYTP